MVGGEIFLAQADAFGRDFNQFVIGYIFDGLFEREISGWREENQII